MTSEVAWIVGSPQRAPLGDQAWRDLLAITDRSLCTPLLRDREGLPDWVRAEVEARLVKIAQRREALLSTYSSAAAALEKRGVEFVLLKGFTHETDAAVDPRMRAQSDIDLLCHPRDMEAGLAALIGGGFHIHGGGELSANHGPPLVKPHTWQWRGDYFDPTHPVPLELHHSIWSPTRDRIETPGTQAFWDRRTRMDAAGFSVPALQAQDRLCIAALHLLRHVLCNNVRPMHAWELALMFTQRSEDFWSEWAALHPPRLRALQAVAFRFAALWFGGELPRLVQADWNALPPRIHRWFETSAFSPLEDRTRPNKDVVWLHLALLPKLADRLAVARRRFIPLRAPHAEEAAGSYFSHLAQRSFYHARALAGTVGRPAARSKTPHTSD